MSAHIKAIKYIFIVCVTPPTCRSHLFNGKKYQNFIKRTDAM